MKPDRTNTMAELAATCSWVFGVSDGETERYYMEKPLYETLFTGILSDEYDAMERGGVVTIKRKIK
jgi:hypothetical protein